ncbi:helix-turn-helix domain-containing protein [Bradyrhizobium yuanmingense]|uniref:helix-turn-helix domain-containing protein n=1 Tax=Bradyrhizobium TaxID=374 RepID=UPI001CD43192|nr:helix-turn-helix domain-containing protein [Bradyrhizobium sp. CB1024]MCA1429792.1 helix-turn-helix domain-containing protein [Bradyrhizobium sp. NBAIM16]MCA1508040.1 helix-turn-helix domain-containing protein [Bradyrhizobium sp. NBAIM02]UWU82548.1 helix-turn-helix domain-containing protein [Bradyrhizobium sp. CB1024]
MLIEFDHRASDSPYVERVWRSRSRRGGSFLSMAEGNIELVVTRLPELLAVTLRGPVTRGTLVECPASGEWLAIRFRLGTYLPEIPTSALIDHQNMQLPVLPNGRFLFSGLSWDIPGYDDAESLVARMARAGVIARSHATDAAIDGDVDWMSRRSVQRHFRRVTGMTFSSHQQIERARRAAVLLVSGSSVLDATSGAGYFDQAHLTRSVRQLIGMTPARLSRERPQLSFSYKTTTS